MKNRIKAILGTFSLLACTLLVSAQDIITLKTGEEIKAKVVEIEPSVIKYKKWENLSGPAYSLNKSEVFMVQYENGSKEVFTNLQQAPANEPNNTTLKPKPVTYKYKNEIAGGATMTALGAAFIPTGLALTIIGGFEEGTYSYNYYTGRYEYYDASALWGTGAAFLITGTAFAIAGPIQLSKGIKHRKEFKRSRTTLEFTPIANPVYNHYLRTELVRPQNMFSLKFSF